MATTRDDLQIAQVVIADINRMGVVLRRAAEAALAINSKIDGLIAIQDKKDKLIAGLAALDVNLAQLNSDKTTIENTANGILSAIDELTTY